MLTKLDITYMGNAWMTVLKCLASWTTKSKTIFIYIFFFFLLEQSNITILFTSICITALSKESQMFPHMAGIEVHPRQKKKNNTNAYTDTSSSVCKAEKTVVHPMTSRRVTSAVWTSSKLVNVQLSRKAQGGKMAPYPLQSSDRRGAKTLHWS